MIKCVDNIIYLLFSATLGREYYFANDTLYMASLVLVTIYSAIHVLAQCYARFNSFPKSRQNGLNKNSITLKREVWVAVATVRFEYH